MPIRYQIRILIGHFERAVTDVTGIGKLILYRSIDDDYHYGRQSSQFGLYDGFTVSTQSVPLELFSSLPATLAIEGVTGPEFNKARDRRERAVRESWMK